MPEVTTTCPICGVTFTHRYNRGRPRIYCSDRCRIKSAAKRPSTRAALKRHRSTDAFRAKAREQYARAKIAKRCEWCDAPFTTNQRAKLTCSKGCKEALTVYVKRDGKPYASRWPQHRESTPLRYFDCEDCGRLACYAARDKNAKRCPECRVRRSKKKAEARFIIGCCIRCGEWATLDREAYASLQVGGFYCGATCRRRDAASRRRARESGAYRGDVRRADVFKRDRFTCQICGKRLAMAKVAPHPKAPSIDHIIPLAQGGTHEMLNVQAAHFGCNSGKRDGQRNDQRLLIG